MRPFARYDCREAGLPEPEFQLTDGFLTTLRRPQRAAIDLVADPVADPVDTKPSASQVEALETHVGTKSAPSRDQVALSGHQVDVLRKCQITNGIPELMVLTGRTDRTKYRNQVLKPLLAGNLLEMTLPDKPTSSKQQYRTTEAGRRVLEQIETEEGHP